MRHVLPDATGHKFQFQAGQPVVKHTGDYQWQGTVVAAFLTLGEKERYVVSHPVDTGEVLHIYGPQNLAAI